MIKLTLIGLVINIKNNKTALVSVRKQFKHKLYKKVLFRGYIMLFIFMEVPTTITR